MTNIFSMEGKTVLIIGSTRGLGWAVAQAVAEAAATVVLHGRTEDTGKAYKAELEARGLKADYLAFDMTERVYGAGFCNGTGVSRGAVFGKAVAEYACGMTSRAIEILLKRNRPSRAYPKPINALGVTASTRYRLWMAGKEV